MFWFTAAVLVAIAVVAYVLARRHALASVSGEIVKLHSLPSFHGAYAIVWAVLPALLILIAWSVISPRIVENLLLSEVAPQVQDLSALQLDVFLGDARAIYQGNIPSQDTEERRAAAEIFGSLTSTSGWAMIAVVVIVSLLGLRHALSSIAPRLRARNIVERVVRWVLIVCSAVAILTTIGIVLSLVFESARFFARIPFFEFLFGIEWSPQTAIRADQVAAQGSFGAIPLFAGTMLITLIAMLVAAPIGLMSAIYLSDYASHRFRAVAKPMLEVLAGIPTVVYGFFAALTVAPYFRGLGESVGLDVASESALAAGIVMGIMIIPFVSSLSDDVINSVPQALRDGSYGMGATRSETIKRVVLPAALPGIVSALLLAVSRAIGETMIVVMAAGLAANLTINPLEAVTTVTVQIATLLVGDQEFDSAKTLAAFALGLVLFFVTLGLNVIALRVVQKYREAYD